MTYFKTGAAPKLTQSKANIENELFEAMQNWENEEDDLIVQGDDDYQEDCIMVGGASS